MEKSMIPIKTITLKLTFVLIMLLIWGFMNSFGQETSASKVIRVVCVGASITEGARIKNPKENSFPGQLQSLLGVNYKVENFGVGGTTMLRKGNYPYWKTDAYQLALKSNPDIVFIDLGGNDAKAINRVYYDELEGDCRDMINLFKNLPSNPRIILLLPTAFFVTDTIGIYDPVSVGKVVPHLQNAAFQEGVEVLDLHPLLVDRPDLVPDKIHPEEQGSGIIAKRLFQQIVQPFDSDFDIFKNFKQKYTVSNFKGYACANLQLNGRAAKVVKPKKAAEGRPWIWRARFWAHEPQTDIALLERGFHLVYYDQSELMGSKQVVANWDQFYTLLTNAGLSKKATLEGMSRGAVYVFNWAAANPDKVAAVYVDNPLLDCKAMFTGPNGEEKPDNEVSLAIMKSYQVTRQQMKDFRESPIDKVDKIVKGNYPILILCGELDQAAVNSQNTFPFEKKIKALGGNITVVEKKGFGHHPHSLPNPALIVDFILQATSKNLYSSEKKYNSYKGLAMAGYQGWFSAPGDGANRGWYHYQGSNGFRPGSAKVDMWPDVTEYDKTYKTEFSFADGRPAYVFSSYDESTVETHFRWMREYGIDGVFVQRFVAEIKRPKSYNQLNKVWHSAINAANLNNRAISVMYDLSGMVPGDEQLVLNDIDSISSRYDIKERRNNPSYLHHNGKPLVAVWGVGFNDNRKYGIKEAETIIDALISRGFSILIGVPTNWRLMVKDAIHDPELHRLIRKCDIVMPWFVGRYNETTFAPFEQLVKDDIAWCKANHLDYAPLAFPGFSWINMNRNSKPIPRNNGSFYWKQLSSHISNGAEMLYLAMFDEIDEGTAIFKCATEVPVGESYFLPAEADLGNDYYLFLAGEAGKMLRKEIPLSNKKPVRVIAHKISTNEGK